MRPIDADALKEKFAEILESTYTDDYAKGYVNGLRAALNMPTLTPPNKWVSVEERLPTDEHSVLVFVGYADTTTGFITTSSYFCFDENPHWQWDGLVRDEQRTLFWMPLPAPPERRNSNENN